MLAVLLLAIAAVVMEPTPAIAASSAGGPSSSQSAAFPNLGNSTSLGVRVLKPLYAVIPQTWDGRRNATAVMTVWLRRVGATKGPYDMPHQAQESLRMVVWVDAPWDLQMRAYGHMILPAEHSAWKPRLRVETAEPGPVLDAVLEPGGQQYGMVWGSSPRPYSLRVDLPPGAGNCFKIVESSYPKHKASVCLPPASSDGVCDSLAPPATFTAAAPALYGAIGPLRHRLSTRDWRWYMGSLAGRLVNYVSYHVAMGVTGLLQYADELTREYLIQKPEILDLIRKGHLRLVEWDMPERAHDDNDGKGRPLGYNYDQALFASHALLGTSACGTNLLVLVTDLDEFLYFPQPGRRWPEPWGACMRRTDPRVTDPATTATVFRIQRYDTVTSQVSPKHEPRLWGTPGALPNATGGGAVAAAAGGQRPPSPPHPMSRYDLVCKKPMSTTMVKQAQVPAAGVVLYFVHEGAPLRGRSVLMEPRCVAILHLPNLFRSRRGGSPEDADWRRFRHWLFSEPGDAAALWEL